MKVTGIGRSNTWEHVGFESQPLYETSLLKWKSQSRSTRWYVHGYPSQYAPGSVTMVEGFWCRVNRKLAIGAPTTSTRP